MLRSLSLLPVSGVISPDLYTSPVTYNGAADLFSFTTSVSHTWHAYLSVITKMNDRDERKADRK